MDTQHLEGVLADAIHQRHDFDSLRSREQAKFAVRVIADHTAAPDKSLHYFHASVALEAASKVAHLDAALAAQMTDMRRVLRQLAHTFKEYESARKQYQKAYKGFIGQFAECVDRAKA